MSKHPLVSVLFITYKRVDLLKHAFYSFFRNTDYPHLELVVTDDGSPAAVQDEIRKLGFDKMRLPSVHRGLGANTNAGLRLCTGKYILQLQDDWECRGPAGYLRNAVALMEAKADVGIVKFYGGPHAQEPWLKIPGATEVCYWIPGNSGRKPPVQNAYSDCPHLKSRALADFLGNYAENVRMEACELDYAARFASQTRYRAAYFPAYYNRAFLHRGGAVSFRTRSRLRRLEQRLVPYAQFLKQRHLRAYRAAKAIYTTAVRALFFLSVLRQ